MLLPPVDVVIDGVNVVQPGVLWVSQENQHCTMHDGQWHGAPDLIIEVLSPSTSDYDKETKYMLYERSGVRGYWLVDIPRRLIQVYVRQGSSFAPLGDLGLHQVFVSPVMNHQTVHVNAILGWLE